MKVALAQESTFAQLAELLHKKWPEIEPSTMKLLYRGKVFPLWQRKTTLQGAGLVEGCRAKLMASASTDIRKVREAKELPGLASFEHEVQREISRQTISSDVVPVPNGPYTFQAYEPWQRPGLNPPPSAALNILHSLAADPGILKLMANHKWKVSLLSEMPPEGKVGISPVCLLGVNVNKGQEICLRLRTDDLRGFRKYNSIRETLIHELAHMVYGEHDTDFKQFNSELRREVAALDWKGAPGARALAGATLTAPTLEMELRRVADKSTAQRGRVLDEEHHVHSPEDPRAAAADAALRRARASELTSHPVPSIKSWVVQKGDFVEYRNRDGNWEPAVVVAIDRGVQPPSYGIEINGVYRETEEDRLRALVKSAVAVGEETSHFDLSTKALEDRVHEELEN